MCYIYFHLPGLLVCQQDYSQSYGEIFHKMFEGTRNNRLWGEPMKQTVIADVVALISLRT